MMDITHNNNNLQLVSRAPEDSTRKTPAPGCELYDLVLDMNWHRVHQHVLQNPWDAAYQDGDSWETPLYLALQYRPPLRVVRALIQACPEATKMVARRNRDLPIHIAARCQVSLPILKEVLEATGPAVVQRTKDGSTVLRALWVGRESVGRFATQESKDSPFWQKVRAVLTEMARKRDRSSTKTDTENPANATMDGELKSDEPLLIHAAVSVGSRGCPKEILDFCLKHYRHQVSIRDIYGCLPLHVAVGAGGVTEQAFKANAKTTRRRRLLLKYRTVHGEEDVSVLSALLQPYPDAAIVPVSFNGEEVMPLHLALHSGHSWKEGVKELLEAGPKALSTTDPGTRLYPFQLAALQDGEKDDSDVDLDTIYRLLRFDPNVLDIAQQAAQREGYERVEPSGITKLNSVNKESISERTDDETSPVPHEDSMDAPNLSQVGVNRNASVALCLSAATLAAISAVL